MQSPYVASHEHRVSHQGRNIMGEKIDKAKGKIKQAVGKVTDNPSLVREGKRDVIKGEIKEVVNDVKDSIKKIGK